MLSLRKKQVCWRILTWMTDEQLPDELSSKGLDSNEDISDSIDMLCSSGSAVSFDDHAKNDT